MASQIDGDRDLALPARGVSRRRVMGGALWAAPAVIVATAVPARATSPATTIFAYSLTAQTTQSNPGGGRLRIDMPNFAIQSAAIVNQIVVELTFDALTVGSTYEFLPTSPQWTVTLFDTEFYEAIITYVANPPSGVPDDSIPGFTLLVDPPSGAPSVLSGTLGVGGNGIVNGSNAVPLVAPSQPVAYTEWVP